MPFGPNAKIRFKQSESEDVVANRVRFQPANSTPDLAVPYDEVAKPTPGEDGYTTIALSDLPSAASLDGLYDVHVTAVDDAGTESPFLEIDSVDFDMAPPTAPTDGSVG